MQDLIQRAIDNSQTVHNEWDSRTLEERAEIFLKAADLITGKYRMDLMASTMLGQVKYAKCTRPYFFTRTSNAQRIELQDHICI